MSEQIDIPDIPDYVSVEDAAKRLGISKTRIYKYVNEGRLQAVKASHTIMIPLEELERYKRNITGRPRKSTPPWRVPPTDNDLRITFILVRVLKDKTSILKKRLVEIKQSDDYIFPGTIARYISESETFPERVEIELVWRGAREVDIAEQERELEAFRQKLADVLDWSTAQYSSSRILLHT
jgi:excisionase family DNA binding protein